MSLYESQIIWHLLTLLRNTSKRVAVAGVFIRFLNSFRGVSMSCFLFSQPPSPPPPAPSSAPRKNSEEEAVHAVKALRSMLITGHLIRFFSPQQTALPVRADLLIQKCMEMIKLHLI